MRSKQEDYTKLEDVKPTLVDTEIPEKAKKPNYETLLYYFWEYTNGNWTNNPKVQ